MKKIKREQRLLFRNPRLAQEWHPTKNGTLKPSDITSILGNSSGVILAHNHPSGSLEPSNEDIETTKRLCDAGKILGIDIKDHLIVSHGKYVSMLGEGLMEVA